MGTVLRDDNRNALRYNRVMIKINTFHTAFIGHAGYVNHSRIWHFKIFGSFNHIRTRNCQEKKQFVVTNTEVIMLYQIITL